MTSAFPFLEDDGQDAAIINVTLTDRRGTVIPDAAELVSFDIENGSVLGVGNGNPVSHEPDTAPYRRLYHGMAQLILKPDNGKTVTVKARTESGFTAKLQIPVRHKTGIPYMEPVNRIAIDGWKLYYRLFDEMPDPALQTEANDMNSFEPVAFQGVPQAELSGKYGKYALYRTEFAVGEPSEGRKLFVRKVLGEVYVYIDGKEAGRRIECKEGSMSVMLDGTLAGLHELTVIIKNVDKKQQEAGICSPVCLVR